MWIAGLLSVLSLFMYGMVLSRMPKFLRLPFYPSYASFTFPFVISATGMKLMREFLMEIGRPVRILDFIVPVQMGIAVLLVTYVLLRYLLFLEGAEWKKNTPRESLPTL